MKSLFYRVVAWWQSLSLRGKLVRCLIVAMTIGVISGIIAGCAFVSKIKSKIENVSTQYGITINYGDVSLLGISGVRIENFSIVPLNADTLMSVRAIDVRVGLLKLMLGRVNVRSMMIDRANMNFIKYDSVSNYMMFFRSQTKSPTDSVAINDRGTRSDFGRNVDHIIGLMFDLLPSDASVYNSSVRFNTNDYALAISIDTLLVRNGEFNSVINVSENGDPRFWACSGTTGSSGLGATFNLKSADSISNIHIPYVNYKYGAEVLLDSLSVELSKQRSGGVTHVKGRSAVCGLAVLHKRISPEYVVLDRGEFIYNINVAERSIEVDSSSVIRVNKIECSPYVKLEKDSCWHFRIALSPTTFPSNNLFESLPKGLFKNLEGIKTSGELTYQCLFDLDMACVDSMKLESVLRRGKDFKLLGFGGSDLRRMNGSFLHTVYENGAPVRSFVVGEENPSFRPLSTISPILKMCVLQSEDGQFFYHNGFLIDCIRDALIEDIKRGKFVRGGSTISMQLVKNVFLNRNKNIARKLEEALIVWFIEGNRLSSKERMFEVYLNIAEWGPMVYGIGEASKFYFSKEPSELTVNESIFLASLIPRPKGALYFFGEDGKLKQSYANYFSHIAKRLVVKEVISEEQAAGVSTDITLSGDAKRMLDQRLSGLNGDSTIVMQDISPLLDMPIGE